MTNASLMTFNIAHGRGLSLYQGFHTERGIRKNLNRIADVIKQAQPDIVALQEVDECSHWNRHINLLEYLREATSYPFSAHGIHNTRGGRKRLAYGNAFLSKHPIIETAVIPFGQRDIGEKGFMEIRVKIGDALVDFINLHLDFRSRKIRIQQADRILRNLEEKKPTVNGQLPPIICGDFNASSRGSRDALRELTRRAAAHGNYDFYPKKKRTFPSHFPSRSLDFILAASPIAVDSVEVIKSYASDHLPVFMKFAFDEKQLTQDPIPSLEQDS